MEERADWGMKREEANNRREVGRGRRRKEGTALDDRKTGDLSINYNATAARDSRRNSTEQRSRSDGESGTDAQKETRGIWRFGHG